MIDLDFIPYHTTCVNCDSVDEMGLKLEGCYKILLPTYIFSLHIYSFNKFTEHLMCMRLVPRKYSDKQKEQHTESFFEINLYFWSC